MPAESIEFRAFTATSILTARFAIRADRLTDALNHDETLTLTDVLVVDIATLQERRVSSVEVPREELLIVRAAGRRGSVRRRFRTWPHAVMLTVGPYRVEAIIHTALGADPTAGIYHRQPMVPLTEATVAYSVLGRTIAETFATIIVNRDALTSIDLTPDPVVDRMQHEREAVVAAFAGRGMAAIADPGDPPVLEPSRRAIKVITDRRRTPA